MQVTVVLEHCAGIAELRKFTWALCVRVCSLDVTIELEDLAGTDASAQPAASEAYRGARQSTEAPPTEDEVAALIPSRAVPQQKH